jgi:hypothetical protein
VSPDIFDIRNLQSFIRVVAFSGETAMVAAPKRTFSGDFPVGDSGQDRTRAVKPD